MKSRCYHIRRIDSHEQKPRAVIVFESEKPDGLNKESVEKFLAAHSLSLISFVERLKFGSPTNAEVIS